MKVYSGGYSQHMYDNESLRNGAKDLASAIPVLMRQTGAEVIVVSGKSGIALAFATAMLIDFPIVVVRKAGENSHGHKVEGPADKVFTKYLILDDFIDTGTTVNRIVNDLYTHAEQGYGVGEPAHCVGILEYRKEVPYLDDYSVSKLSHEYETGEGYNYYPRFWVQGARHV